MWAKQSAGSFVALTIVFLKSRDVVGVRITKSSNRDNWIGNTPLDKHITNDSSKAASGHGCELTRNAENEEGPYLENGDRHDVRVPRVW